MGLNARDEVAAVLNGHRALLDRYHVRSVAIFGSVARGEATADSDIDLLVEFSTPIGLFQFVRLKAALEDILERPVDLATPKSLKPQLRERILKEAVRAA